jgi:hypothetical protein
MNEYRSARPGEGDSVLFETDEGARIVKQGGTRAWRNNNPGNIVAGRFADRHGAIGEAGGFAVFPDEAAGRQALDALLGTRAYQQLTVGAAISRYAPPNENDTGQYVRNIEQFAGVSASKRMDQLTPEEKTRVIDAIRRIEDWQEGKTVPIRPRKLRPGPQSSLDRAVESLDETAVRAIMNSRPYTDPGHADHQRTHRKVQAWFERQFGTEPVPLDATGRMIRPARPALSDRGSAKAGCVVEVRQHFRDDGNVHVDAHTRSCRSS